MHLIQLENYLFRLKNSLIGFELTWYFNRAYGKPGNPDPEAEPDPEPEPEPEPEK